MEDGFPYIDILIFALVAVFLIVRLRGMLGKRSGYEDSNEPPMVNRLRDADAQRDEDGSASSDNVVQLPDRGNRPASADAPATGNGALTQIQQLDPYFNQQDFLNGARMAFEMIVDAFTKGDTDTLRPLLSREVFRNFESAIENREKTGEIEETTLVGIDSAEITDASLEGRYAYVTVKFVSKEVSVVRNAAGDVVSGDPGKEVEIVDQWTFARNVDANDPNWQLVATESPE